MKKLRFQHSDRDLQLGVMYLYISQLSGILIHFILSINKKLNANYVASLHVFRMRGRTFQAIKDIINDVKLSPHERILLQLIMSLSVKEGYCFATNRYLSTKLGKSAPRVKVYLARLEKEGLIMTENEITRTGKRRIIHVQFHNLRKRYLRTPIEKE